LRLVRARPPGLASQPDRLRRPERARPAREPAGLRMRPDSVHRVDTTAAARPRRACNSHPLRALRPRSCCLTHKTHSTMTTTVTSTTPRLASLIAGVCTELSTPTRAESTALQLYDHL